MRSSLQKGFTLIELAIVLVILGLLAGGILVGQDLIKAASLRSQIDQFDNYNLAASTFRTKYNALPGDLSGPGNFNLPATGCTGAGVGLGNGNGVIESSGSTATAGFPGEPLMFYAQLSSAALISDPITTSGAAVTCSAAAATTVKNGNMPAKKLGGGRMYPSGFGGLHYYLLANFGNAAATTGAFSAAPGEALVPTDAFNIDSKMDDGVPNAGIVRPITMAAATTAASLNAAGETGSSDVGSATPAAGDCWNTTNNSYATTLTAIGCQLRIRASF